MNEPRIKLIERIRKLKNRPRLIPPIHKHLTDMETWAIIRSQTGVTNPTAFQQLDRTIQNNTFVILKQEGASIKQIQRLTGIGRNIIQRA